LPGREGFFSYHLMLAIIFMTYKQIKLNHSHAFLQSIAADYFVKSEMKDVRRKKKNERRKKLEWNDD
jgi:hypothetical protein